MKVLYKGDCEGLRPRKQLKGEGGERAKVNSAAEESGLPSSTVGLEELAHEEA